MSKIVDRYEQFKSVMNEVVSNEFTEWLLKNGFFTAPASTKYHGNYEGGLFDHSIAVTDSLGQMTKNNHCINWKNRRSPYIVGMFHDLCKIDSYNAVKKDHYSEERNSWEYSYDYNNETLYKGHGDKSVILLSSHLQLTDEEVACIRYHMGAFTDKEQWNDYTRAVSKYPNVLWTHTADMIAAHILNT